MKKKCYMCHSGQREVSGKEKLIIRINNIIKATLKILICLLSAFIIINSSAGAQDNSTSQKPSKPIILRHADVMEGYDSESGETREFIGNVRLAQGNVEVFCDRALHYITLNNAELTGNVKITQDNLILKAPHIFYNGNTRLADADGGVFMQDSSITLQADYGKYSTETLMADFRRNVVLKDKNKTLTADNGKYSRRTRIAEFENDVKIEDDTATIYSDKLVYDRNTRESRSFGDVVLIGKVNNSILNCDTLINIPSNNYTQASGKPSLFKIDTIKNTRKPETVDSLGLSVHPTDSSESIKYDTLSISSDKMETNRQNNEEIYEFTGNVELYKSDVMAEAGKAVYDRNSESIYLYGKPVVWYDSTQLHADSMIIHFPENKLETIHAYGNAIASYRDDTLRLIRINQLFGSELIITAKNDTIRNIKSFGDAKSLYFMHSEESGEGVDRKGADTISLVFVEGELDNIIWLGGVQAEYFPEVMIDGKETEYYLPSFRWSENKPVKKRIRLRDEL